ncbi:MAG: RNA polymerase sigma factor, partial [Pseudonocardiaceae bacterium]
MTASCGQGDAELVAGLRAGDQRCLAGIYDRYADRLYDFCAGMLHNRDDAADAVQDTFVLVNSRIGQLRDPERLRPWLYAIARSVALARARARGRVRPTDTVIDTPDPAAGPERLAEQEALRLLVADASEGLSEGDRVMLHLHLHGLEGAELGAALGISTSTAHVRLSRLRDQMERSLGALLVARLGRRDCDELTAVLGEWDGRFTPLLRKRVARHLDHCSRCGELRRAAASPWALLSGV